VKASRPGWLTWLRTLPQQAAALLKGKAETIAHAAQEAMSASALPVRKDALARVRAEAMRLLADPPAEPSVSAADEALVRRLRDETARSNRNNVTRTAAYLNVYSDHPELHWALLAHLVSRNGGWTMTDLKGELLPCLLGPGQREALFRFLEQANGFIFHDAYPQLLLYRESLRTGRSLTHLLPRLGVTKFMRPVWDEFARSGDSALLTCALIVNEQHFIEERVVRNPYFKKNVLDTLAFKTQALLQLNHIVFPCDGKTGGSSRIRLAGLILENFADLAERIRFGQQLYAILYGLPDVAGGAHAFARRQPHTGSRTDYWPELFAPVRRGAPEPAYRPKLAAGSGPALAPGASPFFSPRLEHAWKDRPVEPPEPGDWFRDASALKLLPESLAPPFFFDMTEEHIFALRKIELAILAAQEMGAKD
jgi:hypothetical protein